MNALDIELLRAFRSARVHMPAAELATQLRAPVAQVKARVAELCAAGFEIEQHPGLGYRLLAAPDRLIADDIHAHLGACPLVREIVVFEETDSTNDRATQLGRRGVAGGVAIFAERQTAGRGRFGRRWSSASHRGLWFSLLLRPAIPVGQWARLTTWAGAGIAAAIEDATGLSAQIKWPNDVLVHGRKVAGILIETVFDPAAEPFAVVGIGVNVNHEPHDFPPELSATAGSLRMASGRVLDRSPLASAIFRALDTRTDFLDSKFENLVAEAERRSTLLGRWIEVRAADTILAGTATSLNAEGQLLMRVADGSIHTLAAGEVTILSRNFKNDSSA